MMATVKETEFASVSVSDPFRALAETTPDAIVTADATDHIVYVNPAGERLLGYSAAELIGQPVGTIVPVNLRSAHHGGLERYVRTRKARLVGTTVEVEVRRSDGTHVPVELSLGVAGDKDITLTALIRDVSERVRRERHAVAQIAVTSILSEPDGPDQRARVVAALTQSLGWDVGVLWLAQGSRFQVAELWQAQAEATATFAAACRASALSPGEGAGVWSGVATEPAVVHGPDSASVHPRREAALAVGLQFGVALPLTTEGEIVGVLELFSAADASLDDGLRDMLTTVASQIAESVRRQQHASDLARSNADLLRSNTDLDQFASIVAHDLTDPLRTIAGFAELLQARSHPQPDGEPIDYAGIILSSADRAQRILNSLLDFARIGSAAITDERADLNPVAADAVVALQAAIAESSASVSVAELPTVRGNAALLGQVLQNLLANAVKFRGEQPPVVTVSAERAGGFWRIDVADNGRGIRPDVGVFEMFNRAGRTDESGLGIGLALCRKVVERHGGRIWFDTELGRGTTFHFTVPASEPAA